MKRLVFSLMLLLTVSVLKSYSQGLNKVLINPGSGFMSWEWLYPYLSLKDSPSDKLKPATSLVYFCMNNLTSDTCIYKDGRINERQVYKEVKRFFDKTLDYKRNIRYVVCLGSTYDGNALNHPQIISNASSDDGKLYLWYPQRMYNLIRKQKYPPLVTKAIYPQKFKETKNVSILDFRNALVQKYYEAVIRQFVRYLKEPVQSPKLESSSNAVTLCRKGDFISRIEISFMGPWGEGITSYYKDYKDSKPLIKIAELFKKYLYDYWIIAPSYGMRTNTTPNKNLYEFQYYLLTTTYGSQKRDRNGLYYGKKEFGLGVSHLGQQDYKNDFSLNYKNFDFKNKALQKSKVAPFLGENGGQIIDETKLLLQNIKEYGVSLCKPWCAGNINDIPAEYHEKWAEAAKFFGYRFYFSIPNIEIKNNALRVYFHLGNRSYSPLYDDFWLPQIVIRDSNDSLLQVIDADKFINLKSTPCLKDSFKYEVMVNKTIPLKTALPKGAKVYFRVIDKYHINENMFLDNEWRTRNGEYLLR